MRCVTALRIGVCMHALAVLAKINGFIIVLPWVCVCVKRQLARFQQAVII